MIYNIVVLIIVIKMLLLGYWDSITGSTSTRSKSDSSTNNYVYLNCYYSSSGDAH